MASPRSAICIYCNSPIDPDNIEDHIVKCPRHPAYHYLRALTQLLNSVSRNADLADAHLDPQVAAALRTSIHAACREAFTPVEESLPALQPLSGA